MQSYIDKITAEKTPHERRTLSMQVAGVLTALLFVGWVGTLGVRLANTPLPKTDLGAQTAAALVAVQEASTSLMAAYPGY